MSTAQEYIEQEQYKVLLCVESNTVIDPWAVMIHFGHTSLASWAMMWVGWLDRVALLAFLWHQLVQNADVPRINYDIALYNRLLFFFCFIIDTFHHRLKSPSILVLNDWLQGLLLWTANIYWVKFIYQNTHWEIYIITLSRSSIMHVLICEQRVLNMWEGLAEFKRQLISIQFLVISREDTGLRQHAFQVARVNHEDIVMKN